MLTAEMAQREIDAGLAAVCAWCEHHWNVKQGQLRPGCQQAECGGPMVGRAFPLYRGPRPDKAAYCYVCGRESDMAVGFGSGGVIGCCENHEGMLRQMLARSSRKLVVRERVVPVLGGVDAPEKS